MSYYTPEAKVRLKEVHDEVIIFELPNPNIGSFFSLGCPLLTMPAITDIKFIENEFCILGVKIFFADGFNEKAVCTGEDEFNFERGLEICMMKKFLSSGTFLRTGEATDYEKSLGSTIYNKLVDYALKKFTQLMEAEAKAEEEKEVIKRKKAKAAKKKAERVAKQKEEFIEMEKEAFKRAINEIKLESVKATKGLKE